MKHVPLVVLVGRMNVGKSTLFNRISSNVKSLIFDYPGTTRDIIHDTVTWHNRRFELVDTGGLSLQTKKISNLQKKVHEKAYEALEKADVVLLVVDGSIGLMPEDQTIAGRIHELGKKIIIVVNKSDIGTTSEHLHEFQACGSADIVAISAEHGRGVNDLLDTVVHFLPAHGSQQQQEPSCRVMLLGRPNVGKSSLMNMLVRSERSIVYNEPGTTREAVSETIAFDKEHLILTDTPGLRRKSSVGEELEKSMVHTALQALEQTDVVLLLIDGSQGVIVDQELKLAFYAFTERYKALIIVINKADIMNDEQKIALDETLARYTHLIKKVPLLTISCITEKNVGKVLPLVKKVGERHKQELPIEEVAQLFSQALMKTPLIRNQQKLVVYDVRQLARAPITIGLGVNEPAWFGASQIAFFENILRKKYDLVGVPVKFIIRKQLSRKPTS